MSLKERITIPNYTLGEELWNAISHGLGAMLSIAALVLCVVKSSIKDSAIAVVACSIYGASLIFLYLMSTLYHSLKVNNAKRVFSLESASYCIAASPCDGASLNFTLRCTTVLNTRSSKCLTTSL